MISYQLLFVVLVVVVLLVSLASNLAMLRLKAKSYDTFLKTTLERVDNLEELLRIKDDRIRDLESAVYKTLNENLDLADGDNCTLIDLKKVVLFK